MLDFDSVTLFWVLLVFALVALFILLISFCYWCIHKKEVQLEHERELLGLQNTFAIDEKNIALQARKLDIKSRQLDLCKNCRSKCCGDCEIQSYDFIK